MSNNMLNPVHVLNIPQRYDVDNGVASPRFVQTQMFVACSLMSASGPMGFGDQQTMECHVDRTCARQHGTVSNLWFPGGAMIPKCVYGCQFESGPSRIPMILYPIFIIYCWLFIPFIPNFFSPLYHLYHLILVQGANMIIPVIIPSKSTSSIMLFTSVVCYLMLYPTISNDIPTTIPINSHQITLLKKTHTISIV